MSKYDCKKCNKKAGMCICDLSTYTDIGDISAVEFVEKHLKYHEGAGSPIYQGWAYKHNQMKHKLNEKDKEIEKLKEELSHLKKAGACNACESVGEENVKLRGVIRTINDELILLNSCIIEMNGKLYEKIKELGGGDG